MSQIENGALFSIIINIIKNYCLNFKSHSLSLKNYLLKKQTEETNVESHYYIPFPESSNF